jgi:hypothetical protein
MIRKNEDVIFHRLTKKSYEREEVLMRRICKLERQGSLVRTYYPQIDALLPQWTFRELTFWSKPVFARRVNGLYF